MFHQEKGSALWADILYVEHRVDDDLDALPLKKIGINLLDAPKSVEQVNMARPQITTALDLKNLNSIDLTSSATC